MAFAIVISYWAPEKKTLPKGKKCLCLFDIGKEMRTLPQKKEINWKKSVKANRVVSKKQWPLPVFIHSETWRSRVRISRMW